MSNDHTEATVHVNGIDLHYAIDGAGPALLLLQTPAAALTTV
jgi:hypothetical protein